jgi:hypothetical protein
MENKKVAISQMFSEYNPVRYIVYNYVHILPITTVSSEVTSPVAGSVGISVGGSIKSEIKEHEY